MSATPAATFRPFDGERGRTMLRAAELAGVQPPAWFVPFDEWAERCVRALDPSKIPALPDADWTPALLSLLAPDGPDDTPLAANSPTSVRGRRVYAPERAHRLAHALFAAAWRLPREPHLIERPLGDPELHVSGLRAPAHEMGGLALGTLEHPPAEQIAVRGTDPQNAGRAVCFRVRFSLASLTCETREELLALWATLCFLVGEPIPQGVIRRHELEELQQLHSMLNRAAGFFEGHGAPAGAPSIGEDLHHAATALRPALANIEDRWRTTTEAAQDEHLEGRPASSHTSKEVSQ